MIKRLCHLKNNYINLADEEYFIDNKIDKPLKKIFDHKIIQISGRNIEKIKQYMRELDMNFIDLTNEINNDENYKRRVDEYFKKIRRNNEDIYMIKRTSRNYLSCRYILQTYLDQSFSCDIILIT